MGSWDSQSRPVAAFGAAIAGERRARARCGRTADPAVERGRTVVAADGVAGGLSVSAERRREDLSHRLVNNEWPKVVGKRSLLAITIYCDLKDTRHDDHPIQRADNHNAEVGETRIRTVKRLAPDPHSDQCKQPESHGEPANRHKQRHRAR